MAVEARAAASDTSHPVAEPGVIAASVYAGGRRVAEIAVDDAGGWAKRPGHVVWIGLLEPEPGLLARVQTQFGLHELAIEDAAKPHQRPKLEQYGDALFIVARTAQMIDGRIVFGETHIFVGRGYLVSVRHGPSTSYAIVRQRCEACPAVLSNGADYILYALLDFIVDNYMPVLEAIHAEVEAMEDKVFVQTLAQAEVQRLYMLRRDLLRLRNAALPLVEVCRRLEHADVRPMDAAMQPLFRDVMNQDRAWAGKEPHGFDGVHQQGRVTPQFRPGHPRQAHFLGTRRPDQRENCFLPLQRHPHRIRAENHQADPGRVRSGQITARLGSGQFHFSQAADVATRCVTT